ncbi:MAG: hypothetical protein WCW26_05220 [Candidatus Buchananbacteria bacterium]
MKNPPKQPPDGTLFSAVISADTAVLAEKGKPPKSPFWVMHRGKKWLMPQSTPQIETMFQDCPTMTMREATVDQIRKQMELLRNGHNCQRLVIMAVDPEEDADIQRDARREAEALLKKPDVAEWVMGVLYSRWIDPETGIEASLARAKASGRQPHLRDLLKDWQECLPAIEKVAKAWDRLSCPGKDELFRRLMYAGKFYHLVHELLPNIEEEDVAFECMIEINTNPDAFLLNMTIRLK